MLTELHVKNYRCLADIRLSLSPFVVLVGPNGAGKSTILDVFKFVSEALSDNLPNAIDRRGGISSVRRRSGGHPSNVTVGLRFKIPRPGTARRSGSGTVRSPKQTTILKEEAALLNTLEGEYSFTIKTERGRSYSVSEESLTAHDPLGNRAAWFKRTKDKLQCSAQLKPKLEPSRLCLGLVSAHQDFSPFADFLTGISVYSVQPNRLREPQEPSEGIRMKPDGSNAASVVRDIKRDNPAAYTRILEMLSRIVPGVKEVGVAHQGTKLYLTFKVDVGDKFPWKFESYVMSDGTLRVLGILSALEQSPLPSLLGIEEPESTIHPGALAGLIEVLRETSSRTQVILTTHSPDALDAVPMESIRCVRFYKGRTVITEPSEGAVKAMLEQLMTPGELMRANVLEPDELEIQKRLDDYAVS